TNSAEGVPQCSRHFARARNVCGRRCRTSMSGGLPEVLLHRLVGVVGLVHGSASRYSAESAFIVLSSRRSRAYDFSYDSPGLRFDSAYARIRSSTTSRRAAFANVAPSDARLAASESFVIRSSRLCTSWAKVFATLPPGPAACFASSNIWFSYSALE